MAEKPTITDVAREAGVSIATVSYVFNGKKSISAETRGRVMAAVEKLDYVPNLSARSLSGNDSLLIGVCVPQTEQGSALMFQNGFYGEILGAIEYEARIHGYHLLISGTNPEESYLDLARKRDLDGIIAIGVYPSEFYTKAGQSRIPLVLVDSYCPGQHNHSIRIDDTYAGFLAARYLLDKGHRAIAFFCGQLRDDGVMRKRLDGYKQALQSAGTPYNEKRVYEGRVEYQSGAESAKALMCAQTKATAVLAAADILAIGAVSAFEKEGWRVPGDISVMGFDDLEIAQYVPPGLTTVHQQIAQKGKKAVELLVQSIKEPGLTKREEILPVNIVERGSVRDLKGGGAM
ncbi:MAG: LacI family transcriptional regulator [Clostridiales bacterium]|jgi:LacI family transcriptional regulator|nr:LacI family transcriptional regulator [Clostridiales bacterium]